MSCNLTANYFGQIINRYSLLQSKSTSNLENPFIQKTNKLVCSPVRFTRFILHIHCINSNKFSIKFDNKSHEYL